MIAGKGRFVLILVLQVFLLTSLALAEPNEFKPPVTKHDILQGSIRQAPSPYAEVEIVLDDTFSLDDAFALETAPGGEAEISDDGKYDFLRHRGERTDDCWRGRHRPNLRMAKAGHLCRAVLVSAPPRSG